MLQTSEKLLFQGKHPKCQTSEKTKSAANIRKAAFPWQTSDVSNNRKTKKCCKPAKTSFTRANIRYVKHPKNQKVLQLSENQLNHGKHPICQLSEKPKSAANIQKAAFPGQQPDKSNFRKTKKGCKHAKTSFTRTNIRYFNNPKNQKVLQLSENQLYHVKHPKNQKVLQLSENQLNHGKHPICQLSEKPKSAANIRKAAFSGQTSDMSNIRKTKKCCKHAKTSLTRANIRNVKHSKTKKCCKQPKSSFTKAIIQYVKHSKTKNCCKHPKSCFSRANIRNVKHPKKQKVLQTSEKQLFHGKHPMYQTTEKPKSAANLRKPALPGQTSDMSNI